MFLNDSYVVKDTSILLETVRQYSFGTLVSVGRNGRLQQTKGIFVPYEGNTSLETHLAKADSFVTSVADGAEVLLTFDGPWAYISGTWASNMGGISTVNFQTVQITGIYTVLPEQQDLMRILEATARQEERKLRQCGPEPYNSWSPHDVAASKLDALAQHVTGIRIAVQEIRGYDKLDQDRGPVDRASVIGHLYRRRVPREIEVADLMETHR